MDSNPIRHPSPAKKIKCSFLDYVQLLIMSRTGQWTRTLSTTPLQPKIWNACFWITFNFWWLARLVDGLKPHPPPLSSQNNKMLIFGFHSTSGDRPGWSMDSNPICHPSPAKKMKMLVFRIMFNFWWSAGLVDGLEPHPPPLSSQNNKMLIFGLSSTSGDRPGWSMDSNPICHPSPAKKMKMLIFRIMFNFWWSAGLVDGLEPHPPPLSSQKNKMLIFWIMFNFWWLAGLVDGLEPCLPPLSGQ